MGLFVNRNVIVTGASGGIGGDLASMFGSEGARVALLSRRIELISQAADEIRKRNGVAIPVQCDVTEPEQVRHAVDVVRRAFGSIDLLVNSAGLLIPDLFSEARAEDLRRMMDVNYFGAVNTIRAVLPLMHATGGGNIVNISSIAGRRGGMTLSGYAASKFALIGFTESLQVELFPTPIKASLVVPGLVDTEMLENPQWQARDWAFGRFKMSPRWVTWGVIAAVLLGLAEVEVPFGVVTLEKLAALFPDLTTAWLGFSSNAIDLLGGWLGLRGR